MTELEVLHRATVGEDEIDELGHMNVRFYLEKALLATGALTDRHGLSPEACGKHGAVLELRGVYTRHYREQMVGAELVVKGGVLAVHSEGLRLYHELINPARDERAATFVHDLQLRDLESRAPHLLPEKPSESAGNATVEWPPEGRPRTLDIDAPPPRLELSVARERGLEIRAERVVLPEECEPDGYLIASRYQDLVWGGDPVEERQARSWLHDMEDGGKFGWATLESRGVLLELPRVGARVQSFGAEVSLTQKTSLRHHWVFDLDRGTLLCTSSIVNLAFDIGARRAIEIPAAIRKSLEADYHPDLL